MTKVYMATKSDLEQVKAAFNANDTTNVGYITWQMCLMKNYLKLNGMPLVNASIDYADLLQFAVDHELITTDVNDKALFKYDEVEDVLMLPDYMDLCLQGGTMVKIEKAGLPNITGWHTWLPHTSFGYDGVFGKEGSGQNMLSTHAESGSIDRLTFDASRSSTVYGASSTVQPPAIKLIPQIKYRRGADGQVNGDGTPLGTVIMFMGTVAPADYLFCDGTTYAIAEYVSFARFIQEQFGSVNHFGGDGETTFAVPDLRGEFLRCTGENEHVNQGNGAAVGVHQDGTELPYLIAQSDGYISGAKSDSGVAEPIKYDSALNTADGRGYARATTDNMNNFGGNSHFTSRPTNTSVMYCIKAKSGDE